MVLEEIVTGYFGWELNRRFHMLGVPVDLATPDALHPALKDEILKEAHHVA